MSNVPIEFGTDGWRAVIADDYTFANLERVAQATADWLHADYGASPSVVLGHDTRFLGPQFARRAARVLADAGVEVTVADSIVSTPAISWATQATDHEAGVVITASHNPPEYNGYKIKAHFGGPAPPEMISKVEAAVPDGPRDAAPPPFGDLSADGFIYADDVRGGYLDALRRTLDIEALRSADLTIAHDAMYGAGQGYVQALLGEDQVVPLRHAHNPGFHGVAPEPIEDRLQELSETVATSDCDAGLANDGDADRIGMMDENGDFVSSHRILALLTKYLYEERGLTGSIVKTFSTTHMLDKMGERYDLPVETTPIGFKHIASQMAEGDVLVGGEESGGIAATGHIPERDGLYIGLLIAEMMVKRDLPLSTLVDELLDEFGPHYNYRDDIHIREDQKADVLDRLDNQGGLDTVDGHTVEEVQTLDGFKHVVDNGWLLIRPSGTEPVLRVYSEAESPEAAAALVKDASHQLGLDE
ncbi:MAG: phosphoglucomutase/phosphomannomutase family protein [Salinibacter sp.]|uniref:phosphoglucomutase/phosphomannomutase family protein n=1 Tax=Salinibacter sp. TaxID=2065818 RepID=UPI0035D455CA